MKPRRSPVSVQLPPHGVYVWETQHDHGFRMDPEAHPFAEIFYVLDGRGSFDVAGTPAACAAGDVVIIPPGVRHAIEDGPAPLTLYGIGVSADLLARDPEAELRAGVVSARPLAAKVRDGVRKLLYEQTDTRPGHRALIAGQALQLVALLARAPAPRGDPPADTSRRAVERFVAELAHRFYEPVRLDRVAADLELSRRTFTRLFREAAGCSYADYVEKARVEYACRLLRETGRGIAAIAFECGYEDLSGFYRAFKRHTRVPPGRWRESGRPVPVLCRGPIRQPD
jgi:AraC family L-rhamnose operon regulatory protein RhaS